MGVLYLFSISIAFATLWPTFQKIENGIIYLLSSGIMMAVVWILMTLILSGKSKRLFDCYRLTIDGQVIEMKNGNNHRSIDIDNIRKISQKADHSIVIESKTLARIYISKYIERRDDLFAILNASSRVEYSPEVFKYIQYIPIVAFAVIRIQRSNFNPYIYLIASGLAIVSLVITCIRKVANKEKNVLIYAFLLFEGWICYHLARGSLSIISALF